MIFNKKLKLFLFVLSLMEYVESRSLAVSQIGDISILMSEDKWICDQIECPLDTDHCLVSKSNLKKPHEIERSNICYSKDNKVLKEKVTRTPTDPKYIVNVQVICNADGGMTLYNGDDNFDFDEEKLQNNLSEMHDNIHYQMDDFHENLDREMKNLHSNLQTMHENIHRNVHNQMQHLEHNLRFYGHYENEDHYEDADQYEDEDVYEDEDHYEYEDQDYY